MAVGTPWFEGFFDRNQAYLKMAFLLALVLVLLIPLALIEGVVYERTLRRDVVTAEIGRTWGQPQILAGPVLIVPYRYTIERQKGDKTELVERRAQAFFLPEHLEITGETLPEVRYRGIFKAIVYSASLQLRGRFTPPRFGPLGIEDKDVFWSDAVLAFGVTDLRGARGEPRVAWGGAEVVLLPGTTGELLGSGAHAPVPLDREATSALPFALDLQLTGSRSISFSPVGKTTEVALTSSWPHPSFNGAYLPSQRTVNDEGFEAAWSISYLGRDYPQSWTSRDHEAGSLPHRLGASQFGVGLISPVDFYQKTERSVKYGALFIVLIFAAIFIFEIIAPLRIHAIQYALLGFALCLFYLLLLSLAEIIGFLAAYFIAAVMSAALVTVYIGRFLGSRRRTLVVAGILAAVYGYLYIILQLETFALVSGALGLFVALAAVMYATRNVDWYAIRKA